MSAQNINPVEDDKQVMETVEGSNIAKLDPAEAEIAQAAHAYDSKYHRKALRKMDLILLPLLTVLYLTGSFDKSNLGNAKTLGMIKDIGGDPDGKKYAFLNSLYFISYAPFMIPFSLLAKRTRFRLVIPLAGMTWGAASLGSAGIQSFSGAYAARFFVGLGESGFGGLIQVYMARFYPRKDLGIRVGLWLAMAPLGGFFNGIIAYGVSFIHSHIANWRVLYLIEGSCTLFIAILCLILLPEDLPTCRFLKGQEREHLIYLRSLENREEEHDINWTHVRKSFIRWQQILPVLMYGTQQISGAALAAFLPTFTSENGFEGATAQIATLAPYGSAAVVMIIVSYFSDRYQNRGIPTQLGFICGILGFGLYLGAKVTNHHAHFAGLIFAEVGHYICTPIILTWVANNAGSESRRAVALPLTVCISQAIAVGSGYLFPAPEKPHYVKGNAACLALSAFGMLACGLYQYLLVWENRRRNKREGVPEAGSHPDTITHADEAPGFRYFY